MKKLEKNELMAIDGGGEFEWKEAAVAFLLGGLIGVGIYWYFCD
jgi:hypothetical protein